MLHATKPVRYEGIAGGKGYNKRRDGKIPREGASAKFCSVEIHLTETQMEWDWKLETMCRSTKLEAEL